MIPGSIASSLSSPVHVHTNTARTTKSDRTANSARTLRTSHRMASCPCGAALPGSVLGADTGPTQCRNGGRAGVDDAPALSPLHRRLPGPALPGGEQGEMVLPAPTRPGDRGAAFPPSPTVDQPRGSGQSAAACGRPHHARPSGLLHGARRGGEHLCRFAGRTRCGTRRARRHDHELRQRGVMGEHHRHHGRLRRPLSGHRSRAAGRRGADGRRNQPARCGDRDTGVVDHRTGSRGGHCSPSNDRCPHRGFARGDPFSQPIRGRTQTGDGSGRPARGDWQ